MNSYLHATLLQYSSSTIAHFISAGGTVPAWLSETGLALLTSLSLRWLQLHLDGL